MAFVCHRTAISLRPVKFAAGSTTLICRTFASTLNQSARRRVLTSPDSPTFYTARSTYYDHIASLEFAIKGTRDALADLALWPLPRETSRSIPQLAPVWKNKNEIANAFQSGLSISRHRRLVELLNQLNHFRSIANASGHLEIVYALNDVLEMFERRNVEEILSTQKKPVPIDELGRAYAVGRRKTSSARVWVISSKHAVKAQAKKEGEAILPVTEVMVNSKPINEYFRIPADRERILRPFRVAGLLGAYNVFTIVRGGGLSGQSGAIAHGIAKCLAAHVLDAEQALRRAGLIRRDPRMVERKKTGKAKARKAYTWVKR